MPNAPPPPPSQKKSEEVKSFIDLACMEQGQMDDNQQLSVKKKLED